MVQSLHLEQVATAVCPPKACQRSYPLYLKVQEAMLQRSLPHIPEPGHVGRWCGLWKMRWRVQHRQSRNLTRLLPPSRSSRRGQSRRQSGTSEGIHVSVRHFLPVRKDRRLPPIDLRARNVVMCRIFHRHDLDGGKELVRKIPHSVLLHHPHRRLLLEAGSQTLRTMMEKTAMASRTGQLESCSRQAPSEVLDLELDQQLNPVLTCQNEHAVRCIGRKKG